MTYPILDQTVVRGRRIRRLSCEKGLESGSLGFVEGSGGELGRLGAEDVRVAGDALRTVVAISFCCLYEEGDVAYEEDATGGEAGSDPLFNRSRN